MSEPVIAPPEILEAETVSMIRGALAVAAKGDKQARQIAVTLSPILDSHEALRAALVVSQEETARALAEGEQYRIERDLVSGFRDDWYANDLPQMQRLAMWLDPDPDKPLPNLDRLVDGAITRAEAAEAELVVSQEETARAREQYEVAYAEGARDAAQEYRALLAEAAVLNGETTDG